MSDIQIHFQEKTGSIKALHGVNNGPVCFGSLINVSHYYKELGVPYVRLHDPNWPHPREVDIYTIFPDEAADPSDPSNYDFARTDAYIQSIVETGAKIVYRLGVSIEHTKNKYYIHPPKDYHKWAQVCIHIIKHYNEGWKEGFHYNIEYWEIWNEPDGHPNVEASKSGMWTGTHEQYFELYHTASTAIKQYNPNLKVGSFAATMIHPEFTRKFFVYCEQHNLPLDFFSWHTYTDDPLEILANARLVDHLLHKHGYLHAESHFNEWNYIRLSGTGGKKLWSVGGEYTRRTAFERLKGEEGAAFAAAVLILLQNERVDVANYYDGQPSSIFCGLFDYYGVPQKTYYAFKAFYELYRCHTMVKTEISAEFSDLYCCAGINEHEAGVLVSNFSSATRTIRIALDHIHYPDGYRLETYIVDKEKNLERTAISECRDSCLTLSSEMQGFSLLLYKMKAL